MASSSTSHSIPPKWKNQLSTSIPDSQIGANHTDQRTKRSAQLDPDLFTKQALGGIGAAVSGAANI